MVVLFHWSLNNGGCAEFDLNCFLRFFAPPRHVGREFFKLILLTTLWGLFATAFAAATVLPMQSEALLVALLLKTEYWPWLLVAVASAGNILGACLNWWLGKFMERFKGRWWFPVSEAALMRAQNRYHRYGKWSLLLSWVPFIGDPLTVIAGVMKEKFITFVSLVAVAKAGRYTAIALYLQLLMPPQLS